MFVACGIWCLADVSSVSPSSEQKTARMAYSNVYGLAAIERPTCTAKGDQCFYF